MRQIKRRIQKQKKKEAKKQMKSVIDLMLNGIPDKCTACGAKYDKKDKQHAQTFKVEVTESLKQVLLYCPDCQKGEPTYGC